MHDGGAPGRRSDPPATSARHILVHRSARGSTCRTIAPRLGSAGGVRAHERWRVIQVLDQTVDWYRTLGTQQQLAKEPSDLLIFYENRQTANEVMGLAFDLARADADVLDQEPAAAQPGDPARLALKH